MYRRLLLSAPLIVALLLPLVAHAQQTPQPLRPTITVSGEGIVRVVPDKATVRFGVVTRNADPEEARRLNAEAAAQALNAVRALGVPERQIRLETLQLQPVREYNPETRQAEDRGYEALRLLVVELSDLDQLPTLIAEIVQEGANRLDGITYDVADRDAPQQAALQQAVEKAQAKAQALALPLGVSVGAPLQVIEQNYDFPRPMMRFGMAESAMLKADAEPDAYAAGEIEVRATVQIVFELR